MFDRFGTNPTQLIGILSFAAATIACLRATRYPWLPDARAWKVLAFVNCLFLIEIFVGLRHRTHDIANRILMAEGKYAQRGPVQEIIILSLAAIAVILAVLVLFRYQAAGRAARVAISITIAVLALFAIETVSLHAVDAVFYRSIGPLLLIGWIWALASAAIVFAASWR
jgi:hypothetical protein